MKKKLLLAAAAMSMACGFAKADTVRFTDLDPSNTNKPEFSYSNSAGLSVSTGLSALTFNTSEQGQNALSGINYGNVYMLLSHNPASGQGPLTNSAIANNGNVNTSIIDSTTYLTQSLQTDDYFQIWTNGSGTKTDVGSFQNKLVLAGTIHQLTLQVQKTGTSIQGHLTSSDVEYTGGDIYLNYFAPSELSNPGLFGFDLTSLKWTGTSPNNLFGTSNNHINNFTADASGGFDATVIPLPSAVWLGSGLLGVLGLVNRFRKNRTTNVI